MAARRTDRPATSKLPGRETKATSRKSDAVDANGNAKPGLGLADAIALVTFVILIGAIITTDYALGHQFASGVFFKP